MEPKRDALESSILTVILAVVLTIMQINIAWFGVRNPALQRTTHLALAIVLAYLAYGGKKGAVRGKAWMCLDFILAVAAALALGFFVKNHDILGQWMVFVNPFTQADYVIGLVSTILLLEAARRTTGPALPSVALLFLLYGYFGKLLPGPLHHAGFSLPQMMELCYFGFDGVYGIPIGTSATLIAAFIIFGTFFEVVGGGDALMDLGKYMVGRMRGGPAKIAVVTSSLFGTISGSAVANVYATGSFTIPLMKRTGYRPSFAGAVEACSSTGGQIVPPVMGAAAFVMADITGIPYIRILGAALIPSLLYYLSLFLMVDFEAAAGGLQGVSEEDLPSRSDVLGKVHLLIPVAIVIVAMVMGFSPMRAAMYAVISSILITLIKARRIQPRLVLEALEVSGRRIVVMAISTAVSGIIIGIVTYTGLGMNFIGFVTKNFTGSVLGPVLIAVATIILGMGVPTTVAYIIVSAVAVPSLRAMGFELLPSHMFAFYFAVLSMITPPVAPASLAASELAGTGFFETGLAACRIGLVSFIVPFMFLYSPQLLMIGTKPEVLIAALTAVLGTTCFCAGIYGWFKKHLGWITRGCLVVAGLLLIKPGVRTDTIGLLLIAVAAVLTFRRSGQKKEPMAL